MDCGKDFFGNEYASHTKCISEAEKYQGALFSGGGGATKGEKKQEEWLEVCIVMSDILYQLVSFMSACPTITMSACEYIVL